MIQSRRILIVSYYFPPDSAVGGLRAAKFARTLPEFGWQPYVLTVVDDARDQGIDAERLRGLEGVPITRVRGLPTLASLYVRARNGLRGLFGMDRKAADSAATIPLTPAGRSPRETLAQRLKRYVVSLVVLLPDQAKNWSLASAVQAVRLVRRHDIDCILTSGPPFSTHLVGLIAKLFTRVRWLADFRDPWVEMLPARFPETHSRVSDHLETWMEAAVIKRADRVLTTTERLRASLMGRFPGLQAEKFVCLSNSIDTGRFPVDEQVAKYGPLTITYAGTLYFDRTPEPLFRAVGELIGNRAIRESDIRIKLVGRCQEVDGVDTRTIARRYGLDAVVEVIEPVPYSEAIAIMRRSHLLLVIAPDGHQLVVGAKLFDYLGSGSSILGLASEGATADLIRETRSGRCFSPADVAGLRDYIHELIRDNAYRDVRNDPSRFEHYTVRHLTRRLVSEFSAAGVTSIRDLASGIDGARAETHVNRSQAAPLQPGM
ncbi:MAG TPA: glycosyltransferase family 4 protein [Vicinamibacterales bacterium]|nr:glycosyltransferase family 4 protein [Vicinamibacterales bacterium]